MEQQPFESPVMHLSCCRTQSIANEQTSFVGEGRLSKHDSLGIRGGDAGNSLLNLLNMFESAGVATTETCKLCRYVNECSVIDEILFEAFDLSIHRACTHPTGPHRQTTNSMRIWHLRQ